MELDSRVVGGEDNTAGEEPDMELAEIDNVAMVGNSSRVGAQEADATEENRSTNPLVEKEHNEGAGDPMEVMVMGAKGLEDKMDVDIDEVIKQAGQRKATSPTTPSSSRGPTNTTAREEEVREKTGTPK